MAATVDQIFVDRINQNLGIAHRVGRLYFPDADERQEVIQEMMFQLWRSYPFFDERSKFSTWMYSVCLNTALTYKRNDKRRKMESLAIAHQQIPDETPDDKEEALTQLMNAIARLSPVNKAIMLLYLEDMSYDEIAAVTGLSRSNVSVRLVRIKKDLETQLVKKTKSE